MVRVFLLLLPLAVYFGAVSREYGLRDDYSFLREGREEPGKVTRVCAMQARPVYGIAAEWTFGVAGTIRALSGLRFFSAVLIGLTAISLYGLMLRARWDRPTAALLAALVAVLPSSQIIVAWAVCWPLALALLFALAAYACAARSFDARSSAGAATGSPPRHLNPHFGWWAAAVLFATASALTYQSNALFYFAPVAIALWSRRHAAPAATMAWATRHALVAGLGLFAAFTVMSVAFARGWVPPSNRVALETAWLAKLEWFVFSPLQNALGLLALHEEGGSRIVHRAAVLVTVVLIGGMVCEWRARGWRHGLVLFALLAALLVGSFSVNLVVNDRWPAYRVILPLASVVLAFFARSLLVLGGRQLTRFVLAVLLLLGVWLAHEQTTALVAVPQARELALIREALVRLDLDQRPRIAVVTPTPFDRSTSRIYGDEFGSLSTDSDWAPKEMIKLVLRERFRGGPALEQRYAVTCSRRPPAPGTYDVLIDLRRLREFRR